MATAAGHVPEALSPPRVPRYRKYCLIKRHKSPVTPKKHYMLTRKPHQAEHLTPSPPLSPVGSPHPPPSNDIYARDKEGNVLEFSVLGLVEDLKRVAAEQEIKSGDSSNCSFRMKALSPHACPPRNAAGIASPFSPAQSIRVDNVSNPDAPQHRLSLFDRESYLRQLEQTHKKAMDMRGKELEAEQKLIELLPLEERLTLKREGMVLERWCRDQQGWESTRIKLRKKIGRRKGLSVMDTGGDYRERSEELDTLQMAIPPMEKDAQSYWRMGLRENHERSERVGNAMSGLYCPIRERQKAPSMIRRSLALFASGPVLMPPDVLDTAADQQQARKDTTTIHSRAAVTGIAFTTQRPGMDRQSSKWRQSTYLKAMKRRLYKELPTVRPHEVTETELVGLQVHVPDLFEWAIASSKAFFRRLDQEAAAEHAAMMRAAIIGDVEWVSPSSSTEWRVEYPDAQEQTSAYAAVTSNQAIGPQLHIVSSRHILLCANIATLTHGILHVRNTGNTSIVFHITRASSLGQLTTTHRAADREKLAGDLRPLFACHQAWGMLLPGAEQNVIFSFKVDHPGLFQERWILQLTPRAQIHPELEEELEDDEDVERLGHGQEGSSGHAMEFRGNVPIYLQGVCTAEETNEHNRDQLRQGFGRAARKLDVEELLVEILREVRTPRHEEQIRQEDRLAFERINYYQGLYYDPAQHAAFADLYTRIRGCLLHHKHQAKAARKRSRSVAPSVRDIRGPSPEEEDSDEEIWLPSQWNSSVRQLQLGLVKILDACHKRELVVSDSDGIRPISSTPDMQAGKIAIGRAKIPSAFVNAVAADLEEAADDVLSQVLDFAGEMRLLQVRSAMRKQQSQLPVAEKALGALADAIVDACWRARDENAIPASELIPALSSPFVSEEGRLLWEQAMATGAERLSHEAEPAVIQSGAAGRNAAKKPPPKADKKDPKGKKSATEQQCSSPRRMNLYRFDFYSTLLQQLGDICERFAGQALQGDVTFAANYRRHTSLTVINKGVVRQTDLQHANVVVYADLDLAGDMIYDSTLGSWILPEGHKRAKQGRFPAAVQSLLQMLSVDPACLIILSRYSRPPISNSEQASSSLADLGPALSSALGVAVNFIPNLFPHLGRAQFSPGVYLVEQIGYPGLVVPPTPERSKGSDDDAERLPSFEDTRTERRRQRREKTERESAAKMTLGKALSPVADVLVIDDPHGCLDEDSPLSKLRPSSGCVLAGLTLHHDLTAAGYFAEMKERSRLAVIGGQNVMDRLFMLDSLIDTVDTIVIGGALAVTFLYASGRKVGGSERLVDQGLLSAVRELLNKAQRGNCRFVLPCDLVLGEAEVSRDGVVVPQLEEEAVASGGSEKDEEEDREEEGPGGQQTQSLREGLGDSLLGLGVEEPDQEQRRTEEGSAGLSQQEPEALDSSVGFEYNYKVQIHSLEQGDVPAQQYILDIGPESVKIMRELLAGVSTVFWDGVLGVVECEAFQAATRALVDTLVVAHDEERKVVLVNGGSTAKWGLLFADVAEGEQEEESQKETDDGSNDAGGSLQRPKAFSHIFHESRLVRRVLATVPVPLVESIIDRAPFEEETLLAEALRDRAMERQAQANEDREDRRRQEEDGEEKEEDTEATNDESDE